MRKLIAGVVLCLAAWALGLTCALAGDASSSMNEVTGIPTYMGPEYSSLDSLHRDTNNLPPEFHAFNHRGVDEVGYSPLTLDDFRYPVPMRSRKEFSWERLGYPKKAVQVWKGDCSDYTVSAFFFTRDMVRDHIQMIIDTYNICDPAIVQQLIDYYAEVTPQCGEAISWVWFQINDPNNSKCMQAGEENRYFANYLSSFKDKFHLEFGLPKVQDKVDNEVHDFLYQYKERGKFGCSPDLKKLKCKDCAGKGCNKCDRGCNKGCGSCNEKKCGCDKCEKKQCGCEKKCGTCDKCKSCKGKGECAECTGCPNCCGGLYNEESALQMQADAAAAAPGVKGECGCETGVCQECCPHKQCKVYDEQINCKDLRYKGFNFDPNQHYVYYPRKVVIEDIVYDHVAQAYRWKFAWRFNDCELNFLKEMCQYGINTNMALVLSDPQWYGYSTLGNGLERSILASADPTTWGNVWPAGKIPFDATCCPCQMPNCPGNCEHLPAVGFEGPEAPPAPEMPDEPDMPWEPPVETPPGKVIGNG
jgi:hypothetical protein